jgi:undecaprenyl-diphosphatase
MHAIVYGIVQGVTAYLPISSDAHIRLIQVLLGWTQDESPAFTAFTAVIQIAPTLAVILFFRHEIVKAFAAWFDALKGKNKDSHDAKLVWGVIWGTIPILVLGVALQKEIETVFRSLYYISFSLIAVAVVMYYADRVQRERRDVGDVEIKDGVIVGLWQCLALIPGMSRSGSTITGSLLQGFKRESAARFAFLLGIPSFLAAGIFEGIKYHKELTHGLLTPLAVSFVIAFVVAYGCLAWFLGYLQKNGVGPFVLYRLILGVLILGLVFAKVVTPDAGAKPLEKPADTPTAMIQSPLGH